VVLSTRLALYLLGAPRLELDNAPVTADRRKTLALLAYLAVNRWQHHRDHISALLWPDHDQPKAYTNLRHILWEVQQLIGEGWVVARRDTIGLIPEADHSSSPSGAGRTIWLDVARFKALINESRAQKEAARRIPLLLDSVNLYRNHFLTGFSLKHSPVFNEWAVAESEDLRHQFAQALALLSEDHCSLGQAEITIPYAQRLITLDPLNETSHRLMMQVYIQAGQNGAALTQYQTCEQILRRELGVDPQPETRALYRQIRKGEIKPIQLVKQKETVAPGHNLPFQISKFIGRENELDAIADLIAEHRLVTLVGTGGIGKTRLSLKVGEGLLNEYADGVWLVELASLSDPALVPQTVATMFHLVEGSEEPLTEKLIRVLRAKNILLILDNCEHLLDACAQLADALLRNCPNLKILTTSREALGITGEAQYHVPPLGLPDLQQIMEKLLDFESVELFEERARLIQENFSLTMENASSIAQICHRLDGIPLAIELAAARVNQFSTEQIAAQLNENFNLLTGGSRTALPRQQTLRASIDWSWNLLSEPEQALLRRLGVFAGGWTLEGAEAVGVGDGVNDLDVLDLLGNLVEKSLVFINSANERYQMLETIRQYADEKLREIDEVKLIRDRHLAWMLLWAEEIRPELQGRDQVGRMKQVDSEVDNVRTAIEWGLGTGKAELAMRVFISLQHFWDGYQPYQESYRWLEKGISLSRRLSKPTLAMTFCERSWLAFRQNDPDAGLQYGEKGLLLANEFDDPLLTAYALRALGCSHILRGDFQKAEVCFEESYLLYQKSDDTAELVMTVADQALAIGYQGHIDRANEVLENHLHLLDELDDLRTIAHVLLIVGGVKVAQGNWETAARLLKRCLSLSRQLNNLLLIGDCLIVLAGVANAYNAPVRAARLFGAREVLHESIGAELDPGFQRYYTSFVAQTRAMLDESAFASAWADGRAMTMEQAIEYALDEMRTVTNLPAVNVDRSPNASRKA
jgi:predicted ATPase/DNA-binding SARP family transcriptional activator